MTVYPWQQQQWQFLLSQRRQNRLPHALLLTGGSGLGKADFSMALGQLVLCENARDAACGQCRSCQLFTVGSHPDFIHIALEEKSKTIKVDQIRELSEKLHQTSQRGGFQVAVIHSAESMNRSAANALLKTLEEPSGKVLLMLVSYQLGRLPATILSRCQRVVFSCVDQQEATVWLQKQCATEKDYQHVLKVANGAPLAALQLMSENYFGLRDQLLMHLCEIHQKNSNPIAPVSALLKLNLTHLLHAFITIAMDCLRLQLKASVEYIVNSDCVESLRPMSRAIKRPALLALLEQLQQAQVLLGGSISVNTQLLLESLLLRWGNSAPRLGA